MVLNTRKDTPKISLDQGLKLTKIHVPLKDRSYPLCFGIPLPQGRVYRVENLALTTPEGLLPTQWTPLLYWPDQSLKWVLCDTIYLGRGELNLYVLKEPLCPSPLSVHLSNSKGHISLETGPNLRLSIEKDCASVQIFGANQALFPSPALWIITGTKGKRVPLEVTKATLETKGPVRTTLKIEALAKDRKQDLCLRVYLRISLYPSLKLVKIENTIHNPRRARHKGGYWDLGDPGSMYLKKVAFSIPFEAQKGYLKIERDRPWVSTPFFRLYQESSGQKNWASRNHVNRFGEVPLRFQGYRLEQKQEKPLYGRNADPEIHLVNSQWSLRGAFPYFWPNFPKALAYSSKALQIEFFPEEFPDLHEIQGGEQKTHRFWLSFASVPDEALDLDWCFESLQPVFDPEYIRHTKVLAPFATWEENGPEAQRMLASSELFFKKREVIDEYGWRHFGDVYADHENAFSKGPKPLISHYNNQYDLIWGFLKQALRTGDNSWFQLAQELAWHVYDIDIYHTDEDKPAYNHGLFWHTFHYVDAYRSTHRCYSKDAGVTGGGPSNEHLYSSGLMLYYLLTGDPWAYQAVIDFGDHVIEMDKPYKILRWLDATPSGLASQTREPAYHGPGRGAGNAINCLLDAYILTEKDKYLEKAEELIRRCIHPEDDIEALGLRQPEQRWSYTVFLQVLGKYLFWKAEKKAFDYMFAYGRASLLHYARWMAQNEYIYLDRPELLEYPTETWAAQEIRKAEAFFWAAYFSNDPTERLTFRQKGRYFGDEALKRLKRFPSWFYTRPLAIILQCGLDLPWFQKVQVSSWPEEQLDFGTPQKFIPQKLRLKKILFWGLR